MLLRVKRGLLLKEYNMEFYNDMEILSVSSAKEIIPILVERYNPLSVVDIGCGTGAFAFEFMRTGLTKVVGIEGEWMKNVSTILPKDNFFYYDITETIEPNIIYDLCLCLEVAEHLEKSKARILVSSLTSLSSRVVFSAAIPLQGGNHHVNEQWPEYWAALFAEKGYFLEWDPRISIWNNSKIASCYRQNLLVFSRDDGDKQSIPVSLVHPEAWELAFRHRKVPLWLRILYLLPSSFLRLGKKTFNGFSR